jgi:hypothetical protein
MKRVFLLAISALFSIILFAQNNVGVGITSPHRDAALDVYSTTQGLLIPRMSSMQRTTGIATPLPNGLLVFDIDTGCVMAFDSVAALWQNLCSVSGGTAGPTGPAGTNGTNGTNGSNGTNGTNGANGATGPTGANGANGSNGANGATGPTGPTGTGGGALGCTTNNYVVKATTTGSSCSIIYDNGSAVSVNNTAGFGEFDVLQPGGEHILLGGGSNTGSEIKFLNFGTNHFSIYNNGSGEMTFAETSNFAQTNTAGYTLMTIDAGGLVTATDFSATGSGGFLDVMNDLDSIDHIRPLRKVNPKTNKTELVNDASTYPSMVAVKTKNGDYKTDIGNLSSLNTGAIRELRQEAKSRDEMLEARIDRLENLVSQLTGRQLGQMPFTASTTAYRGIESYYIVDARIRPGSAITISGLSDYTIVSQGEGGFGIKFSQPLGSDVKFTYSSAY